MCHVVSFRMKVASAIFCGSLLCFGCNGQDTGPNDEPASNATDASEVSSGDPSQSEAEESSTAGIAENQHSFTSQLDSAKAGVSKSELSSPNSGEAEIPNPLGDRYSGYVPKELIVSENSLAASSVLDWSDAETDDPSAAVVQPPEPVGSRYPSVEDQVPSPQFDAPLGGEQHQGIGTSDLPIAD